MTVHAAANALQQAVRDRQTVTPEGDLIAERIDEVLVRRAVTIADDRGTICEIFNPAWGFTDDDLVYAYEVTIRPGVTKGWNVHLESDDRLFFLYGSSRVVLYDAREDASTYGAVNEIYFDAANRGIVRIPHGVFHAVQNLGTDIAAFVNLPTRPYDHAEPDKYRLPLDSDLIPYRF